MDPIINLQDPAAKIVGRRTPAPDSTMAAQKLGAELAASLKLPMPPRGVYRFKTHEEADAWLMKVWTRQRAN
jgi:hypothetical protein